MDDFVQLKQAILASITLKFGIEIPLVDDEDLNSSSESVKSVPPSTEDGLRNDTNTARKITRALTEDKHETNHINNKYNNTNIDTRKMHNTWACI